MKSVHILRTDQYAFNKKTTRKIGRVFIGLIILMVTIVNLGNVKAGTGAWVEEVTSSSARICWDTTAIPIMNPQWIYTFKLELYKGDAQILVREISAGYYEDYYGNWHLPETRYTTVNGLSPDTTYHFVISYTECTYVDSNGKASDPAHGNPSNLAYVDDYVGSSFTTSSSPSTPPGGGVGGGCPELSTWNGSTYQSSNTILIGSEKTKNISVTDYMKIDSDTEPIEGTYSMKISEFEKERTKLDSIRLLTIDHSPDVKIATTLDNQLITYSNPISANSCIDNKGNNVTGELSKPDDYGIKGYYGDYLIANFGIVEKNHIKLLLRSDIKPTPGGIYPYSFPENKSDRGIVVAIKNENGSWTNISNFMPREKWYTDAFILDPYLSNAAQPLEIAVGWLGYHKLDWIAIDTTKDIPVETHIYSPVKADFNGEDVLNTLLYTDNNNVTLVPKQNMTIEFPYEAPANNMARDLVFISTGRYDTIPRTENIGFDIYQYVHMSVKIEGKPGNTVDINILEDGKKIGNFSITREHGNPANNIKNFSFRKYVGRNYELELVNEGKRGCNPIEMKFMSLFSGRNETIKEKVKAESSDTVEINGTLNDVLQGDRRFYFELAPPYYQIPVEWISEIHWDFGNGWWSYNPEDVCYYNTAGTYQALGQNSSLLL